MFMSSQRRRCTASSRSRIGVFAFGLITVMLATAGVAFAAAPLIIDFDGLAVESGQAAVDEVNASTLEVGTSFVAGLIDEPGGYPRTDGASLVVLTTPAADDARFSFDQNMSVVEVRIGTTPASSLAAVYDAGGNLLKLESALTSVIFQVEADCIRSLLLENSSAAFLIDDLVLEPMADDSGCDDDFDGVINGDDLCPDTLTGVADEPIELKSNRYATNAAGEYISGSGTNSGITVATAGGCSMSQIIEQSGLGQGHTKYGLSKSALTGWVSAI